MFVSWKVVESESESRSVVSDSLPPHGLYSPRNSPGKNTGVGSLSFLQGIFPTQGLNPGLPHCRRILYQLSHKGNPRILEWVAYPFSRASSQHNHNCVDDFLQGHMPRDELLGCDPLWLQPRGWWHHLYATGLLLTLLLPSLTAEFKPINTLLRKDGVGQKMLSPTRRFCILPIT